MKKKYTKPQINIENFTISKNIAADCHIVITNATEGVCPYIDRGGNSIFTNLISDCTYKQVDGEGVCYNVPVPTNDLFNS
ncbi:MAG: hypothetical protein U0L59_03830 [Faecalimonas sp.]|nr:hypothetical protein [Faecalimonas sp.]